MEKRGTGQSWSLDIILAFVIFMLIIGIFYTLLNNKKPPVDVDVQIEASTLMSNLDASSNVDSKLTVISEGSIDKDKLIKLYGSDYDEIKQKFGLTGEFCIYVEDQYGNVIPVETTTGNFTGFGNDSISVGGVKCGVKII